MFLSNEMKCFLQCRRQIFTCLSFFAKKSFQSLIAQNHFFIASKSTNSVFSANDEIARPRMLKNFCFSEKKLNAILRAKLKNMKMFLSNEMKCFLQCRRQIFTCLSFFAKKSFQSLIAQNHFFIASKSTNSVFSANDEIARPRMIKNFCFSEKIC